MPFDSHHGLRQIFFAIFSTLVGMETRLAAEETILTTASELRALSAEIASEGRRVRLEGVALFCGSQHNYGVLHDESGAVFIKGVDGPSVRPGDRLRVEGISAPGDFAPILKVERWEILGSGPLPPPRKTTFAALCHGALDRRWCEVQGVVREVTRVKPNRVNLDLQLEDGRILCRWAPADDIVMDDLVGSVVRVQGVCSSLFEHREFRAPWLFCPTMSCVTIVEPQLNDPFSLPLRSISSLTQFQVKGISNRQMKVRGAVLAVESKNAFYLRDASCAIRVVTPTTTGLLPESEVEVVGFLGTDRVQPTLEDARWKKTGAQIACEPRKLVIAETLPRRLNSDLVHVDGLLVDHAISSDGLILLITVDGHRLTGRLPSLGGIPDISLENGSLIRLTGVWQVKLDTQWQIYEPVPDSLGVLLRSEEDIRVLRAAPWWTTARLERLAILGIGALSAAVGWLLLLGRRNRELAREVRARTAAEFELQKTQSELEERVELRSQELARQTEARHTAETEAAILRERSRLAADLHDTLEQSLTGVALQLESTGRAFDSEPALSRKHLNAAKGLVARTRTEAKRSMWDLRSETLERKDLVGAVEDIAEELKGSGSCEIAVTTSGPRRRLPDDLEKHIFRIAQEGLANALKHGAPRLASVHLEFSEEQITLTIQDDGCGFDPETCVGVAEGHLGLCGMRERSLRLSGTFHLSSAPGRGSKITAVIPIQNTSFALR